MDRLPRGLEAALDPALLAEQDIMMVSFGIADENGVDLEGAVVAMGAAWA